MANDPTDPVLNCLLEVCCVSGSASQRTAMAKLIVDECGCDPALARKMGDYLLATFDLAEKGTLQAFKKSIVRVHGAQAT